MPAQVTRVDPNGDMHVEVTCDYCGKPIVSADKLGMMCEDRCAARTGNKFLDTIIKLMEKIL